MVLISVLDEQSLKESPLPKNISAEDELKILRRKAKETFNSSPPVSSVILKMLQKKPFSLECFRALYEKEKLLDEAIKCGDSDVILTVVLFLNRTLKQKYFYAIVQLRPAAITQYVNYLALRYQIVECCDFLT